MLDIDLKPRTINEIYHETYSKWFRVRHVGLIIDYLVLEADIMVGDYRRVVSCDTGLDSTLDAYEAKYVLLSSPEELKSMRKFKRTDLIEKIRDAYDLSALRKSLGYPKKGKVINIMGS